MTDRERLALLRKAERHLKRTRQGYVQFAESGKGSEWRAAIVALEKLERDLDERVPPLGPVVRGGKSMLLHDLTHKTSGLDFYPAFDDAYEQGEVILAPEALIVDKKLSSAHPGLAFYATGRSKLRYWFGHLDRRHPLGTRFAKGDAIGKVAANSIGGGPHVHVGVNIELIAGAGKQLIHHTDYTHGSPTIGAQLARLLN